MADPKKLAQALIQPKQINDGSGGIISNVLDLFPLQVRTLVQTAIGDRSSITENKLKESELQKLADAIKTSRTYKSTLLDLNKNNMLNDLQKEEYKQFFPNEKSVDYFNSGNGSVQYDDYYNSNQANSDWNIGPSGAIRNTLGKFTYNIDPNGNVRVKDRYDFTGDKVEGLPNEVANTHRYEQMSMPEKLATLLKETVYMPKVGFDPALGVKSLPSRVGNAFIGNAGREININLPNKFNVNPTETDLYYTKKSLLGNK